MKFATLVLALTMSVGPATAATLVHEFDFESGPDDSVGTVTGSLVGGATVSGGVLNLDGVDDYLQFSRNLLPTDGSDFTLAFQALNSRGASQGGIHEIVSQGSSGGPGFYVGNINGQIRFTDQFGALATPTPTDAAFHDYVVTSEVGFGTRFYLDGGLIFSSATTISIGGTTATRVGTQFDSGALAPFNEYFQGQVDNLRVFDGALDSTQVANAFTIAAPVPLPAGAWLLIGGLGALVSMRRRR